MLKLSLMKKLISFLLLFLVLHAHAETKKIMFVGDSITDGYGVTREASYPYLLQERFKKSYPDLEIINASISGSTTASLNSRLPAVVKIRPDIVVIALGGNDGLRGLSISQMKKNLSEGIEKLQKEKIRVVLAGMKLPLNLGKAYRAEFEAAFKVVARNTKAAFYPFLLEGVGGIPELNQADAIHPNEKGQKIIADRFGKFLESLL